MEAVLECVRHNLGFEISQTLRSMLHLSTDPLTNKYKHLYEKQRSAHQAASFSSQSLTEKISTLQIKLLQLQKDPSLQQLQKSASSKQLFTVQSKESRLNKLEMKLLLKEKMLRQEQKHLEVLKVSIRREREMVEEERDVVQEKCWQNNSNESLERLRESLEMRRRSCRELEGKLNEQFFEMEELIERLEDSDPYNI